MKISDVTSSLKPTGKTASAVLLYASALAALALPLVYPALANRMLGPVDAAQVKDLFFDTFKTAMPILLGGGGIGIVAASALKTGGKVVAQLAPGMATVATPNGEGVNLSSGDILKSAGAQILNNEAERATGVDLNQFVPRGLGAFEFDEIEDSESGRGDHDGLTDDEAREVQERALMEQEAQHGNN